MAAKTKPYKRGDCIIYTSKNKEFLEQFAESVTKKPYSVLRQFDKHPILRVGNYEYLIKRDKKGAVSLVPSKNGSMQGSKVLEYILDEKY